MTSVFPLENEYAKEAQNEESKSPGMLKENDG